MSFRKKNRKAEEEDMKISRARGSKGAEQQPQQTAEPQQAAQSQQAAQPQEQAEAQQTEEGQSSDDEEDDSGSEQVPAGTTAEILQWVGDDKDKAQRALDKEQAGDKPRPGLTRGLKKITNDE